MKSASKYTFDTEFRPDGDLISDAARARLKKTYTSEEIEQLSAHARDQGMQTAQVRADEALVAEISTLTIRVRDLLARSRQTADQVRQDAAMLALVAARKLARAAIEGLPAADVASALRGALHQAIGEPRILLHASPRAVDVLTPLLDEIAHQEGFEGRLVIAAEASLAGADCRIEWQGGGVERCEAAIEAAIGELITRHFSNRSTAEE